MKKYPPFIFVSVFIIAFFIPVFIHAAYNDVTLTSDAVLSVGGYTLNVAGSSAVIQSIEVNSTNFTVTLLPGSFLQISSPTFNQLTTDINTFTTSNTCSNNTSVLTLSSSGLSGNVIITPTATVCSGVSVASGASSVGSNGSPIGLLGIHNKQNTSNIVSTTTSVSVPPSTVQSQNGFSGVMFNKDIKLNQSSPDVKLLQQYLNTHNFIIAKTGPGSMGKETEFFGTLTYKALQRFQKSVGIPSTGLFGSITRSYINKQ